MFRIYEYVTDCVAHLPRAPKKGDLVIQRRGPTGVWRNFEGPFGDKPGYIKKTYEEIEERVNELNKEHDVSGLNNLTKREK
jgi:hypothetical protein